MTFQHRSRIKSSVDYSFIASDMGACCLPDSADPIASSYQHCLENDCLFIPTELDNGQPILSGVECPILSDRGCCCACSYVDDFDAFFDAPGSDQNGASQDCADGCYQGGTRDNTTKCECDRLGGVWSVRDCSAFIDDVQQLCTDNNTIQDVRWPGACCVDESCHNVCSVNECSDVDEGTNENTQWRPAEVCCDEVQPPGWVYCSECSDGMYKSAGIRDIRTGISVVNRKSKIFTTAAIEQDLAKNMKSCCIYEDKQNNVVSSVLDESKCTSLGGVWAGVDHDGDYHPTNSTRCQELLDIYANGGSISSSYVNDWKIGEYIFGGRYVGTFNVQSPSFGSGSVCLGNPQTGSVLTYTATDYGDNENSKNKYALFIDTRDLFETRVVLNKSNISSEIISTNSSWDANKNNSTWNNAIQRVLDAKNTKHFNWTVPSMDILAFAYNQTNTLEFIRNLHLDKNKNHPYQRMKSRYYWTNTLYKEKIRGKAYAYTQSFNKKSTVGIRQITDSSYIRPFLLIPVI